MTALIGPVQATILVIAGLLALATALVVALKARGHAQGANLVDRVKTWWIIVVTMAGALAIGPLASTVVLAFVSFLALKEYFSLIPTRQSDRVVLFIAYLAIPVQYWLIGAERYGIFIVFVPVWMLMAVPAVMVIRGETDGFLRATATIHWGLMACVFAIGHAAALLWIDPAGNTATGAGLFVLLLLLTGLNDVAQYVSGKAFGRHKASPTVSPGKTVEGLAGGILVTALVAAFVGPFITPLPPGFCAFLGAALSLGGFLGDLTISGVKRDLGLKDTGTLLPGHGGILDRIDSLIFTAPLFFHLTRFFYF
jgi:phosphatidate cytidylyltransferase